MELAKSSAGANESFPLIVTLVFCCGILSLGTMPARTQPEIDQEELERVLASEIFARSPNLVKILRYIGTECLAGNENAIKEYTIGVEALGRPPDFDPKRDSVVRVEAHRLRDKLEHYYKTEGANHPVVILLQAGHYVPQFRHRGEAERSATGISLVPGASESPESGGLRKIPLATSQTGMCDPGGSVVATDARRAPLARLIQPLVGGRRWPLVIALLLVVIGAGVWVGKKAKSRDAPMGAATSLLAGVQTSAAVAQGNAVRIICGYSQRDYVDQTGEIWGPDRYYSGGQAIVEPQVFIAGAADPTLFETAREGVLSYDIPLKPGRYELRLYFVETQFGPGTHAGGGETSRLFSINLNGKRLLTDFDIYSDAGGNDIADVRAFRDVSPAADGELHLGLVKALDSPVLNALEIIPTPQGKTPPIRIVCQDNSYTDSEGRHWKPDRYFLRGRLATDPTRAQDTPSPGLYAEERYGNFSYAIPVPEGRYAVTLFFDETSFGPGDPVKGGVGSRVFNVDCNGLPLLRNFDIFKEAGGANRPVIETFRNLQPNAQGKLLLSFVPIKNYAEVRAIQVIDESPSALPE